VPAVPIPVGGERPSQQMSVSLTDVDNELYCLSVQLAEPLSHLRASMNSEQLVEAILSDARERSLYDRVVLLQFAIDVVHKSAWRFGENPFEQQAKREQLLDVLACAYTCEQRRWEQIATQFYARDDSWLKAELDASSSERAGLTLFYLIRYEARQALLEPAGSTRARSRISSDGPLQGFLLQRLQQAGNRRLKDLFDRTQAMADEVVAPVPVTRPSDGEDWDVVMGDEQ